MNIKFNYLYRDYANYKKYDCEIFSNTTELDIDEIEKNIISALIDDEWFNANKWNLPDLHFEDWDSEIDHALHEYGSLEQTDEEETKGDIKEFLKHIRCCSK